MLLAASAPATVGQKNMQVAANFQCQVDEASKDNNMGACARHPVVHCLPGPPVHFPSLPGLPPAPVSGALSYTVLPQTALPSFQVSLGGVYPFNLIDGSPYTLWLNINNNGDATASPGRVGAWLGSDTRPACGATPNNSIEVPQVIPAGGELKGLKIRVPLGAKTEQYPVYVWPDYQVGRGRAGSRVHVAAWRARLVRGCKARAPPAMSDAARRVLASGRLPLAALFAHVHPLRSQATAPPCGVSPLPCSAW